MGDHPRDRDSDTRTRPEHERGPARGPARGTYAFAAVVVLLVLGFAVLHVTGVIGPGSH